MNKTDILKLIAQMKIQLKQEIIAEINNNSSDVVEHKPVDDGRCIAYKKDNNRCTKKANKDRLCSVHNKKKPNKTIDDDLPKNSNQRIIKNVVENNDGTFTDIDTNQKLDKQFNPIH